VKLSPHFSLEELTKSQTALRMGIDNTTTERETQALRYVCYKVLEPVREHFAIPFSPSSGFRSKELNDAIGGAVGSQHCLGEAADIEIPGVDNETLARWIVKNLTFDQLILEYYIQGDPSSGWVHVSWVEEARVDNRGDVLTFDGITYEPGLYGGVE